MKELREEMVDSSGPCDGMMAFISAFVTELGFSENQVISRSLAGDGSKRRFWRILAAGSEATYVAMENAPIDLYSERENFAYLTIGRHLFEKGLPIPEIYHCDLRNGWFIMRDLGQTNLQEEASRQRDRSVLYRRTLEILVRLQIEGSKGFNTSWTCQTERYDPFVMRRYEADYFRDSFLHNYLGLKADWPELEGPFTFLAKMASKAENHFFLHRDFQSRNIMVSDAQVGIIDWQGARLGPLAYDVASLIIDPYTNLSSHERTQLYEFYLDRLEDYPSEWADHFRETFPYLAIQRNLQILGAFSFLSKVRGKPYFEAYIPPALRSLDGLLSGLNDQELLPLKDLASALSDSSRFPGSVNLRK
jgi:aminoglycoside/choline kinase family phosphotransferase